SKREYLPQKMRVRHETCPKEVHESVLKGRFGRGAGPEPPATSHHVGGGILMALLSKSPSAFVSLGYVTAGALIEAWSLLWLWWLNRHPPEGEATFFFCYGFLATGAILFFLGLSLGAIGRAARQAELPPPEVTPAAAQAEKNIAVRAPLAPVVPAGTVAPVAAAPPVAA